MTWQPEGLGKIIFQDRYARFEGETWEQACKRVADHVSQAEENGKVQKYGERFEQELIDNRFMPGGRIWYGSGRPKAQLLNCLAGDTLIHTTNGLKPIKELAGKKVNIAQLHKDGPLGSFWTKVPVEFASYGVQELWRVVMSNGDEIYATAQHEWVVSKPKGGYERVTTEELAGRFIPMQHHVLLDADWRPYERGVQHGIVWGDGTLYMNRGYSMAIEFGDSKELIGRYFPDAREWPSNGAAVATKLPVEYKTTIPELDDETDYIIGFIAGAIATDGCVDKYGNVMLHQANLESLIKIRKLAARVGIPSASLKMVRTHNPWTGEPAPLWKLAFVKAAFYRWDTSEPNEQLILKTKHREFLKNAPRPSKQFTVRVESVNPTGEIQEVYCGVNKDTHTLVVGPGYVTGNCFVVPTSDSREGWGKTISDVIVVSGTGGGVGINCSPVRPRGSDIKGTGGKATGAISLMQMIDRVGDVLVSGGGRRLALMLCLDVNHPDIEEFLNVKLSLSELNNANISVILNMPTDSFVEAVQQNSELPLFFGGRNNGGTIMAGDFWNRIVKNAWQSGEPGILNGYEANRLSNIWYHKPLVSTNPCGEIWLEEYGCCCLGALVLPRFVVDGQMDWDQLDTTIRLGVRFLDDVLTVNHYPLPEIKENCEQVRRIGLGVMGLHSMLLELGYKYSSDEGKQFIDKLFSFIKNVSYDASITLAAEKGPFPAYDTRYLDSGFIKTLKRGVRGKIREHGIRNCALLTIAPTGTTGMVSGVSTGIEPLFAPVYYRRFYKPTDDGSRKLAKELVVTPEFEKYGELTEGAYDVSVVDHFEIQKIVQAHIDNAVSKTINLPKDYPVEDLAKIWLEYLPYCKGTTFYREGSRELEPLSPVRLEDALKMKTSKAVVEYNPVEQAAMDCVDGSCELPVDYFIQKEITQEAVIA